MIKFRAWDKDEQRMLNWQYLMNSITYGSNRLMDPEIEDNIFNDPDLIMMQYTGFNDVNGTEIYVGDIVEYECWAVLDGKQIRPMQTMEITWDYHELARLVNIISQDRGVRVIGNIY